MFSERFQADAQLRKFISRGIALVEKESDLRKELPVGSDVEVIVLEIDPSGRRIDLSRKAVLEAVEKSETREYAEHQKEAQADQFGSLADKLRAAMRPRKK